MPQFKGKISFKAQFSKEKIKKNLYKNLALISNTLKV